MRAASFLIMGSFLKCMFVETHWAFLRPLWFKDEQLLTEGLPAWPFEVCFFWFWCFCDERGASVLPEGACIVTGMSLFFTGILSLELLSVWLAVKLPGERVREVGQGCSLTLGVEGGLGLRLGGWLQPDWERSSFNLVDLEAPGFESKDT